MNNITIELCQEDRARIDTLNIALGKLINQLEGVNAAAEAKGLIETQVVEETIYEPDTAPELPQETPETTEPVQAPQEPEIAQDEPTVTHQQIQQKVIELVGKGKKAEARDVITTYADSVSDLPDSSLNEVWKKLTALEG